MKALFAIIVFGYLGNASDAQEATNAQSSVDWKPQALSSGIYEPDRECYWFAGEVIRIDGTNFYYHHFTDVPPFSSDYTGAVVQLKDHILLDHPKVPSPERISGLLSNRPVLWVWDGYQEWKRLGLNPNPSELLYLRETNTAKYYVPRLSDWDYKELAIWAEGYSRKRQRMPEHVQRLKPLKIYFHARNGVVALHRDTVEEHGFYMVTGLSSTTPTAPTGNANKEPWKDWTLNVVSSPSIPSSVRVYEYSRKM